MKRLSLVALLLSFASLVACDSTLQPGDSAEPRLAAFAFPYSDGGWELHLFRTAGLRETATMEELRIEGALVTVSTGGDQGGVDTLRAMEGGGYGPAQASAGATLTLEVSAPGFPPIRARTTIPAAPGVRLTVGGDAGGAPAGRTLPIDIDIEDPPGPTYYAIGLYRPADPDFQGVNWSAVGFESEDPILRTSPADVGGIDLEGEPVGFSRAYFDDRTFDGERGAIRIEVPVRFGGAPRDVHVVVTAMSPEHFRYHRHLALQGRGVEDVLSEPAGLYTNIEGGVGIFAAYANTVQIVSIEGV